MHYDVVSAIKKNKIMNDSYALSIYKDQNNFGPFRIMPVQSVYENIFKTHGQNVLDLF